LLIAFVWARASSLRDMVVLDEVEEAGDPLNAGHVIVLSLPPRP